MILTDRAVDSEDTSLYKSFLGSDFVVEGERAGEWLVDNAADSDVERRRRRSTSSSSRAPPVPLRRSTGPRASPTPSPRTRAIEVTASQTGDFTRDGGKQVMESFLQSDDGIDVVYAHNDDMGLGAIEAIEAAGLTPGKDIKIITVDAVKDGMTALSEGKINYIVECNPLLGPQLMDLAKKVVAGEEVERPDRDRGDHLRPGAGHRRAARPPVLIERRPRDPDRGSLQVRRRARPETPVGPGAPVPPATAVHARRGQEQERDDADGCPPAGARPPSAPTRRPW